MPKGMPEGAKGILGWVLLVATISFILLVMVIIFGNLSGNTGFTQTSSTFSNETIQFNTSGTIPSTADNRVDGSLSGTIVTNATGGETVPANNYTITGVTITADAGSNYTDSEVNVSATVSYDKQSEIDAENIIINYTKSATNTSTQFPTVGTIIGIAILLLILIGLLIFVIKKMMNVSGTASGITSGGTSKKFQGSSRDFS